MKIYNLGGIYMNLQIIDGYNDSLVIALFIVGALIIIMTIVATITQIYLMVSYIKYNRRENSLGKTGEEVARDILDRHDLSHIKVSKNGSFLFGNSYSHYFKKVRLRRLTYRKKSLTSLAMATQKSSLALLDKEGDPDMKTRIALTPIIFFGPLAFIPIVAIGVILDILVFNSNGTVIIVTTALGFAFLIASVVLQFIQLKTEKKAQVRALDLMKSDNLATSEEQELIQRLYHLYNIEYINNIILAILEIIYRILMIALRVNSSSSSSSSK